jgi:adenosine deaminase
MNQNIYIGCCGAYCRTCKAFIEDFCKGCKLGYDNGERDINKAKCKIKVCCFKNMEYDSCADCAKLDSCTIIEDLYSKNGYKYKKYKEAIEFIKQNGYKDFIKLADKWNGAYGKLK